MRFVSSRYGKSAAATGLLAAVVIVSGAGPASAQTGGSVAPGGGTTPGTAPSSGVPGVATLNADGSATAPSDAPKRVRKAINAGNRIRTKPYLWGGGHGSFNAKGYDCSGAASYLLHAAGLLKRPLVSGALGSRWGKKGVGKWITAYGNKGHAYVVIAGLRYDTSDIGESVSRGSGPRWRATPRSPKGYGARFMLGRATP